MNNPHSTEPVPDFFTTYPCSSEFLCASANAEEKTGSFKIPYERKRDLMLKFGLDPVETVALAVTAAARMGNMLRDMRQTIIALEYMANEGVENG